MNTRFKKGIIPWNKGLKNPYGPYKKYFCSICKSVEVLRKAKYCKRCNTFKGFVFFKCVICEKDVFRRITTVKRYKNIFCSRKCLYKNVQERQKGEKSWFWKGGLTDQNRLLRNSKEIKILKRLILERDDFTCQICKQRGGKLDVDHIKSWALFPDLRFELTNMRTLCRSCHLKTDTWGFHSSMFILRKYNKLLN